MEQRDWVSQIPLRDVDFISVTYSSKVWSVFGRVVVAAVVVADVDDVDGVVSDVVAVGVVDYVDGVVADIDGVVSDVVAVGGGWVIAANGDAKCDWKWKWDADPGWQCRRWLIVKRF